MAKVTGIGGVFIRAKGDPQALAEWYKQVLGMPVRPHGTAVLHWAEDEGKDEAATAWRIFEKDSEKFASTKSGAIINYRIDDMDGMLAQLKKHKVKMLREPQSDEYGRFAWLLDPEGNEVELWAPK